MPKFNVKDLIGKVIVANKPVELLRNVSANSPVVFRVVPNQDIGMLQSWVGGTATQPDLYFMFYDGVGAAARPFYAKYEPKAFKLKGLPNDPISIEQQIKDQNKPKPAPKTIGDTINNSLMLIAAAGAFYLFTKNSSRRR